MIPAGLVDRSAPYIQALALLIRIYDGLQTQNKYALWLIILVGLVYCGACCVSTLIVISGKGKLCMLCKEKRVIMGIKM